MIPLWRTEKQKRDHVGALLWGSGDKNEHLVAAFCEKTSEVPTTITGLVAMKRCIDEDAMYMDSVQVIY